MSAATVLPFGGGELSSFDPQDNGCIETTNAGRFDPAVSRCAIQLPTGSAGFTSPTWSATADFFFHGVCWPDATGTNGRVLQLFDGATVILKIAQSGTTWTVYSLQSSVLTVVGALSVFNGAINTIDIRLVAGASGIVEGYLAGTLIFRTTNLNHTDFSGVTQLQCRGPDSGGFTTYWSQIIGDAIAHIGDALVTLAEDTASAVNTGWFGAVSGINEIVLDDSHSVTSDAAGQVGTYYKNGASLGTYNVVAVCVGVRAQLTSGSSTNMQVALRTNGSNYFSPTIALDFGFQACCASWTTNPFAAAAWDPATAAIIEAGMKSIA